MFQDTERHLSEILCRSSPAPRQLSGRFPSSYTKDLCHFCTVFHSQSPWKNSAGDRKIWRYQSPIFQKACDSHPTPQYCGAQPGEKEMRQPLVQDATSFQKLLFGCRKTWKKWRLNHLLTNSLENHLQWSGVGCLSWWFHPFQKGVIHLSTPYAPVQYFSCHQL